VWGCLANIMLHEPKIRKLGSRIGYCDFIGFACNNSCYRFLVIKIYVLDYNVWKKMLFSSRMCFFWKIRKNYCMNLLLLLINLLMMCKNWGEASELENKWISVMILLLILLLMIQHVMVKQLNIFDAFFFWLKAINNELESIMSNHIWNSLS